MCRHQSASKTMIKLHVRQHTREKHFNCDKCEYKTGDHNSLKMTSPPPPNSLGLPPPPSGHLHLAELGIKPRNISILDPAPPYKTSHLLDNPFKNVPPDHSQPAVTNKPSSSKAQSYSLIACKKFLDANPDMVVMAFNKLMKPLADDLENLRATINAFKVKPIPHGS